MQHQLQHSWLQLSECSLGSGSMRSDYRFDREQPTSALRGGPGI
jgi:hypothetical protein